MMAVSRSIAYHAIALIAVLCIAFSQADARAHVRSTHKVVSKDDATRTVTHVPKELAKLVDRKPSPYTRDISDTVPQPPGVLQYVDPFIGTGGFGYGVGSQFPGAQVPFGLMRVSPDTSLGLADLPFQHCGGYAYEDSDVRAFSHIHLVGAGVADLGMLGILPRTEAFDVKCTDHYSCMAKFSHEGEVSYPGYYKVTLGSGIAVELTATQTGAIHRYTYPANTEGHFFFDLGHSISPKAAANISVTYDTTTATLRGQVRDMGGYADRVGGIPLYFTAQFSTAVTNYGVWNNADVQTGGTSIPGNATNAGFFGTFKPANTSAPYTVEIRLAISTLSQQAADFNFQYDSLTPTPSGNASSVTFEDVVSAAYTKWEALLTRVQVNTTGAVNSDLVKLYTGLYHTHMAPTNYSEPNGEYRGYDQQMHKLPTGSTGFYSDMSIWDTHRSQSPLMSLTVPEIQKDLIASLLMMYQQGGSLPRWPLYNGYTGGMLGCHANPIIADAYLKGIPGNYSALLDAMVEQATTSKEKISYNDIEFYMQNGYVTLESSKRCACDTLAYAYDDWAISQVACGLNQTATCSQFQARGKNYKNVYESKRVLFCPRQKDGSFKCPSVLGEVDVFSNNYAEGDALQYRWFVPHDPEGLVALMGNETYLNKLTEFFDLYPIDKSRVLPNPYYWAGNEPDLFAPWMFNFVGKPSLTQKWTRYSLMNDYSTQPDGIPGNDDYGTMSAWQFFAALGFYPQTGSGNYVVGSPLFPAVTIARPDGYKLTITAQNAGGDNVYVKSVAINGTPVTTPTFSHSLIAKGGTIEFVMTNEPTEYF